MPLPTRHTIDPNFKQGGSLGVIEQLDLTTSYPQTVAVVDEFGNQITDFGRTEATSFNGGVVTVGTTAVELTFTGVTQCIGIKAASTNTGIIYIGGAIIDSTGANAVDELTADSFVAIELNDAAAPIYAVASVEGQKIYKNALI